MAGAVQPWENVYVFISSTFNDMHAERDYLVKRVFPELSEWCEARRLRLVDIDLRWGVTEKDSQENKRVVDVCLRNIDRCRPLFLCFLGQRRGWVPQREDISEGTFEGFPKLAGHLGSSVTEMEVLHALIDPMLNGSVMEVSNRERAFFFLRNPRYLDDIADQNVRNVYTNEAEADPDFADAKLAAFKERVRATGRPVTDYVARWDSAATTPELLAPGKPEGIDQGRLTSFKCGGSELSEMVIGQMKDAIEELFPGRQPVCDEAPLQRELDEQARFLQFAQEGFIERAGDFDEIRAYLTSDDPRPCAVCADAGLGKTSFLAQLIGNLHDEGTCEVLYRFVGTSESSVSAASLLASIGEELAERFGLDKVPSEVQKLRESLPDLLAEAAEKASKRLVVIIDAVNQLDTGLDDLTWIPAFLVGDVKFVYSFKLGDRAGDDLHDELVLREETAVLQLRGFENRDDRESLVEQFLSLYLKELDDDKIEAIVSSAGAVNPLFLKVLLTELRVFGSHEGLHDVIAHQFGTTPQQAFDGLLRRLEGDSLYSQIPAQALVANVFGWLSHAKNGLEPGELAELLIEGGFASSREEASDAVNLVLRQLRPYLAKRDKRQDFYYESFLLAARARYEQPGNGGKSDVDWHRELAAYFEKRSIDDTRRLQELAFQYAHAGLADKLVMLLTSYDCMEARLRVTGVQGVIDDYAYVQLPQAGLADSDCDQLTLVREALEMASTILNRDKTQLPVQLHARLLSFDLPLVKRILDDACRFQRERRIPWLKPLCACLPQPGGRIQRNYKTAESCPAQLFADRKRMLICLNGEQTVKVIEIGTGRVVRTYPLGFEPRSLLLIEEDNVFATSSKDSVKIVDLTTGECHPAAGTLSKLPQENPRVLAVHGGLLVSRSYARIFVTRVSTGELLHEFRSREFDSDWNGYNGLSVAFDEETGFLLLTIEERGVTAYDPAEDFQIVRRYGWSDKPLSGYAATRMKTGPKTNWTYAPTGTPYIVSISKYDGVIVYDKYSGEVLLDEMCWDINEVKTALSAERGLFAILFRNRFSLYSLDTFTKSMPSFEARESHRHVTSLEFSHDGSRLFVGWADGLIEVWDTSSWEVVDSCVESGSAVQSIWENVYGTGLVSQGKNQVIVWKRENLPMASNDSSMCLKQHFSASLAPDGSFLLARVDSEIHRIDVPSMKRHKLLTDKRSSGPYISCDSKYFMMECFQNEIGRALFYVMRFFDCADGSVLGEVEPVDTTGTGHSRARRNLDYRLLPEELCIGPRNLTALYRQWGCLVMQDFDAPDDTKVISVFPGSILAMQAFDGDTKVALRSDNKRFDPDAGEDNFFASKDSSIPKDETKVIDLRMGECVEQHATFMEWKATSIKVRDLGDYPVVEALLRTVSGFVEVRVNELCRVQDRLLYYLPREGKGEMRYIVVRDAWREDPVCWYTGDEARRFKDVSCTSDGKYLLITGDTLLPFSLENVFDGGPLPAPEPPSAVMPNRSEEALNQLGHVLSHKEDLESMHEAYLVYSELMERFPKKDLHGKNRGIVEHKLKAFLDELGREVDIDGVERWYETYRDLAVEHAGDGGFATLHGYAEDKLAFLLSHREDLPSKQRAEKLYEDLVERGYAVERNANNLRITRAQIAEIYRLEGKDQGNLESAQKAYSLYGQLADEFPDRPNYRKNQNATEHNLAYLYLNAGLEGDIGHLRKSRELYRAILEREPENAGVLKNMEILEKKLAFLLSKESDADSLQESHDLYAMLAKRYPEDPLWEKNRDIVARKLGETQTKFKCHPDKDEKSVVAGAVQPWENVYVFISSTFNDMHAERDYLVKRVFPELSEWCEERRLRLVDIDLRWGVTEKDSQENKRVVDVCLRNIDRCRPLFLCFMGQRRGWVPNADDIAAATFESFPKLIGHLGASVTEMEITHALIDPMLNGSVMELANRERAFFFLRDAGYLDEITDPNVRAVYTNEAEPDPAWTDAKLAAFKERVRATDRPVLEYTATWDRAARTPELLAPGKPAGIDRGRLTGFRCGDHALSEVVIGQLKDAIDGIFPGREPTSAASTPLQRELDEQARFLQLAQEGFIERAGDFDGITEFITSDDTRPCVVVAPAGAGKTSYLATLMTKLQQRDDTEVLFRFVGASEGSVSVASLLSSIADELIARFGVQRAPTTPQALKNGFGDLLARSAEAMVKKTSTSKRLVVAIDAINQLDVGLNDLSWIPAALPANVKFIYSFKLGEDEGDALLKVLVADGKTEIIPVRLFESMHDREDIVEQFLSLYLKELDDDKVEAIVSSAGAVNPLFLKVLLTELRVFGSHEGLRDKIAREFGDTPKSAFASVLHRLETDPIYSSIPPEVLTRLVFGFLAHAKNGLTARELADLIVGQGAAQSLDEAIDGVNQILRQVRPFLAKREGRHDFFYESFLLAARERYESGPEGWDGTRWHAQLARHFQSKPEDDTRRLFEVPYQLAHAGKGAELVELLSSFSFQFYKLGAFGVQALLDDLDLAQLEIAGVGAAEREALSLIHDAIEMSADVIVKAPDQLATHLYGRLLGFDDPIIAHLLASAEAFLRNQGRAWFKPLRACMTPPGGNLVRIYETSMLGTSLFRDGKRMLVSLASDQTVKVVELRSGRVLKSLPIPGRLYAHLIEDQNAVAIRKQGDLCFVDLDTGKYVFAEGYAGTDGGNPGISFNGLFLDEDSCFADVSKSGVKVTDVKTGKLVHQFPKPLGSFCAQFDADAGLLYLSDEQGQVSTYDPANGFAPVRRYWLDARGPRSAEDAKEAKIVCRDFKVNATMHILVVKCGDGQVRVLDLETGRVVFQVTYLPQQHIALSDDGKILAVGGYSQASDNVELFSMETFTLQATIRRRHTGVDFDAPFLFMEGGTKLVTATYNGRVELWDTCTGDIVERFEGSKGGKPTLAATDDGLLVYAGETVMVWDTRKKARVAQRQELANFKLYSKEACQLDPNGSFVIGVSKEGGLFRFELQDGSMRRLDASEMAWGFKVSVSADGTCCILKHSDRFDIYSCDTGAQLGAIHLDRDAASLLGCEVLAREDGVGARGIAVAMYRGGSLLLADVDHPKELREVAVFDDDIHYLQAFDKGRKLFVQSAAEAKVLDTSSWECLEQSDDRIGLLVSCMDLDGYAQLGDKAREAIRLRMSNQSPRAGMSDLIRCKNATLWHYGAENEARNFIEWYELRDASTGESVCKFVYSQDGVNEFRSSDGTRFAFCGSFTGMMIMSLENAEAACERVKFEAEKRAEEAKRAEVEKPWHEGTLKDAPLRSESELDHLGYETSRDAGIKSQHEAYLVYSELVERFPWKEHHVKNRDITERKIKTALDAFGKEGDMDAVERWYKIYRDLAQAHPSNGGFAALHGYAEDKLAFLLSHREDLPAKQRAEELYKDLVERGYAVERNANNLRITRAQIAELYRLEGKDQGNLESAKKAYELYGQLADEFSDRPNYRKSQQSTEHNLAFLHLEAGLADAGDIWHLRESRELYRAILEREPENAGVLKNMEILEKKLAFLLSKESDINSLEESRDLYAMLAERYPEEPLWEKNRGIVARKLEGRKD